MIPSPRNPDGLLTAIFTLAVTQKDNSLTYTPVVLKGDLALQFQEYLKEHVMYLGDAVEVRGEPTTLIVKEMKDSFPIIREVKCVQAKSFYLFEPHKK